MTLALTGTAIDVIFLLLPGTLLQDWAGPAEALRLANQSHEQAGLAPPFRLRFIGPNERAASSVGAMIADLEALPAELPPGCWLVLSGMPGRELDLQANPVQQALVWLHRQSMALTQQDGAGRLLVTICAGALLAAHAGLLTGRSATTHHQHLNELRQAAADCHVVGNRVFVEDGWLWSSAGITTGIDLALHLIARRCGQACAAQVAQTMVVALRRGADDEELSPFLSYRHHLHPALHRVQDAICQRPQHAWDLTLMANHAHTSPRHLSRLFAEHAGIAPLKYLRRLRLSTAQLALRSGHNVTQAAELAGFASDTQLRRAWHEFGLTGSPSDA